MYLLSRVQTLKILNEYEFKDVHIVEKSDVDDENKVFNMLNTCDLWNNHMWSNKKVLTSVFLFFLLAIVMWLAAHQILNGNMILIQRTENLNRNLKHILIRLRVPSDYEP